MRRSTSIFFAAAAVGAVGVGGWALAPALATSTSVQASTASPSGEPSAGASAGASADPSSRASARQDQRESRIKESLAGLVKDGTITQAQADKVAATLAAEAGTKGGRGMADGHGKGGRGAMMRGGEVLTAAADTLKLSQDELRTKLADASLGEIADQQKVSRTTLVDAMVKAATADLEKKVTDGDLTREQADSRTAKLKERFTAMLDHKKRGS